MRAVPFHDDLVDFFVVAGIVGWVEALIRIPPLQGASYAASKFHRLIEIRVNNRHWVHVEVRDEQIASSIKDHSSRVVQWLCWSEAGCLQIVGLVSESKRSNEISTEAEQLYTPVSRVRNGDFASHVHRNVPRIVELSNILSFSSKSAARENLFVTLRYLFLNSSQNFHTHILIFDFSHPKVE